MTAGNEPPRATYRFTVEEVLRMVDFGLLADARVELLDGELVYVTARGPLHVFIAATLQERLRTALPTGWHVRKKDPLVASPVSAPEPDVSVVRGSPRDYRDHLPTGADCALAIEVSVSTLKEDRRKLAIYAAGGVCEVWIVDVPGRRVERYAAPRAGQYTSRRVLVEGESIEVAVAGAAWPVASLFE